MFRRQIIWQGLEQTAWAVLCVVAVAVAAALIILLLRYERTLVPRRVGRILLCFRMVVLVLLVGMLLQPILAWTLDRVTAGRLVVAIDLSDSMTTTDHHATPAEKLRWARALGLIGNEANNDRLERWIRAYEAGREPDWVDENDPADAQQREHLSAARRDNLQNVFAEIDRIPRKEMALRLLQSTSDPLLPQLAEVGNLQILVFGGTAYTADSETLGRLVAEPPVGMQSAKSDLAGALTSASGESGFESPLMGVVLLTDGRDNVGRDLLNVAERMGATETPVYPVMFGSEQAPRDLSIATVNAPQTVSKTDTPLITATLACAGFAGEEVEVRLERESGEPLVRKVVPKGQTAEVRFQLEAAELGRHTYTVRAPSRPGETRDDNNSRSFAVNVVDDKIHVLLVDGEARWEFRYLDNALARDGNVDLTSVVFRQPYMGVLDSTFFPDDLSSAGEENTDDGSPFGGYDLVILGDVAPEDMSQQVWEQLERFVSEQGGTLVCVAGKQHFPLDFTSPIVERLLPVTHLRPVRFDQATVDASPASRGFRLSLSPEAEKEAMFQFDGERELNRKIWSALPAHSWGVVGEPKPAATVFARVESQKTNAAAPKRDTTQPENDAVFVHQFYGSGQVLYIGIDSTWRWRFRLGDVHHHRFWGQLARWAAENKAATGNEFVQFGPAETDVEAGNDIVVRARWSANFLKRFPELAARAEIFRADAKPGEKPFTTVALKPLENQPPMTEARVATLPVGDYVIKLAADHADLGPAEISAPVYVSPSQTLELSNVAANPQLLTQIAQASRGRLLQPDETRELLDLLKRPEQRTVVQYTFELWNHWAVMLLFFGLLTGEWVVRKLNGLP